MLSIPEIHMKNYSGIPRAMSPLCQVYKMCISNVCSNLIVQICFNICTFKIVDSYKK